MKKDAELHAEEDKKSKELIEARNMADTLAYTTEKAMREAGDKITEDEKKPVQEKIEELNKVKNGDDLEAIKKATEALSQEAQKIGQKMYAAAQAASANATAGDASQPGTEEKPKEAETEPSADKTEKK